MRVEEAIRILGYRPDPALSALAAYRCGEGSGRGNVIAFLDCDASTFTAEQLQGAREEAALLGYSIEPFPFNPKPAAQKQMARILFHRGIRGILFGASDSPLTLSGWIWPEFASVSLGALDHDPAMDSVSADYFHAAFTACERLREAGCQRIALAVEQKLESRTGERWLGGYSAWMSLHEHPPLVFRSPPVIGPHIRAWLQKSRPDGVLTVHPGLQKLFDQRLIRTIYLNSSGALTSSDFFSLDPAVIGREAVRLLHHSLLGRSFGLPEQPRQIVLRGRWKVAEPATGGASRRNAESAEKSSFQKEAKSPK
jgi:hypothetical protein